MRGVPRHEERVAERLEPGVQGVEVELVALDEEDRAEAELGLLVVDRLLRELLGHLRRRRQRLAGETVEDASQQLDESRTARVDHARLPQLVEELRRPRTASSPRSIARASASTAGRLRTSGRSASSAISRMTVSIVPSTGIFTAW